jgi:hypothetical protein
MSSTGQWERKGPPDLLVDKLLAIHQKSDRIMAVDEDHSNLVKFGADDSDCRVIIDCVHNIAENNERLSPTKIVITNSQYGLPEGGKQDVTGQ